MSKYDIDDDHEWQDEKEAKQQREEWENRASLGEHTVTVLYDEENEYQSAEKYECHIKHKDDGPKVLYVVTFRNKGNYWRRLKVDDWIDFHDVPMPARKKVADTLGASVATLTLEERIVNPENDA